MASLFRDKSLAHMRSPEHLDDYIQVSNPGAWMTVIAVILVLAAGIVWGVFGRLDDTQDAVIVVGRNGATCYMDSETASDLSRGDTVRVGDAIGTIGSVGGTPVLASMVTIPGAAKPASGWYDVATAFIDVPSGTYDCQIVVESYSPLELLLGA
ncbi:MAG TPA: hypothetical protein K8U80_10730 [Collinsella ihuae]|uniref:NHLP bacteriocin system secretion protein n=1 Tax=Collinsella ihumii TaxID=1720204 RepID=A0A921IRT7_9ACTN|nr:hypothetical protein [Collinsella ihumii]